MNRTERRQQLKLLRKLAKAQEQDKTAGVTHDELHRLTTEYELITVKLAANGHQIWEYTDKGKELLNLG